MFGFRPRYAQRGSMKVVAAMNSSRTQILSINDEGIARAAAILRAGGTVAFPTETVYGLGANALDADAVANIFVAKGRPNWDPLIVHVAGRAMLAQVAALSERTDEVVEKLIEAFWPGPLTLLLPRTAAVPDAVTAGRALVGVRMPGNAVALELIRQAGVPVAAPSANRFGHTSPTTAAHVLEDLDGRIDAVLDGGPCEVGVESTVLDPEAMVVYRPGAVTVEMVSRATGCALRLYAGLEMKETAQPSPGLELRHYAPRARLVLVDGQVELIGEVMRRDAAKVGVLLPDGWDAAGAGAVFAWGAWDTPEVLARRLFDGLRTLDAGGVEAIVCPMPAMGGLGDALRDRLTRAAR
jgi:L-threonylcarbamoyladenylate synthase